jgi:hypothetical protein
MKQPKYRLSVNDFILFSIAGAVGLASGYIYQVCKWLMLIYVLSGLMVAWLHHFTFIWFYAVPTTSANEKNVAGCVYEWILAGCVCEWSKTANSNSE